MVDEKQQKEEKEEETEKTVDSSVEKKEESSKEEVKEEVKEEPKKEEVKEEVKEEPKKEEVKEESESSDDGEEVEVPKKFKSLVEGIEKMSVLDLHELVKLLEKKFGVSAAAVAVAGNASADAGAAEEDEKSEFNVELKEFGDQKIAVIKVVKAVLGLGLKEAKDMVDDAPTVLKEGMPKEEAENLKAQIEEAGGTVLLK